MTSIISVTQNLGHKQNNRFYLTNIGVNLGQLVKKSSLFLEHILSVQLLNNVQALF